jgi:hypothetical protein
MEYADEAAPSIGEWIEQHPWAAIGAAAGLGTAFGCAATAGGYADFAPGGPATGGVGLTIPCNSAAGHVFTPLAKVT